jgi:pimeloyl-ACP methyl ester carboxylesterase
MTDAASRTWSIPGARGETILGTAHVPPAPRGTVLVAHGFKGYKDYGFIPVLAAACAAAGFVTHRFNFSHSGMTDAIDSFARPDLFERDTWNTQVEDLDAIGAAVADGRLAAGPGTPVLFGHSRGGVSVLLAAGRRAAAGRAQPAAVITAAAPDRCNSLSPEQEAQLLADGRLPSPSSRTGQTLYVGRDFLDEQRADPEAFDLLRVVGAIACPVLVAHGTVDETVPADAARTLAKTLGDRATLRLIDGANHVFNCANPAPPGAERGRELAELIDAVLAHLDVVAAGG